ncbi:MAG: hypothetical protein GX174_14355, partial [Lentisphaerae bacterium]|nr:hypothetical protein [Lentisphaerota bacterium]
AMSQANQFKFNCPHCQQSFLGEPDFAGRTLPCPVCKRPFVIPECPQKHIVVKPQEKKIVLNRPKHKIILHKAGRGTPIAGGGHADGGGADE